MLNILSRGRNKAFVVSSRLDPILLAHMVLVIRKNGGSANGQLSDIVRIIFEAVEDSNISPEERIPSIEDALFFLKAEGFSTLQAEPSPSGVKRPRSSAFTRPLIAGASMHNYGETANMDNLTPDAKKRVMNEAIDMALAEQARIVKVREAEPPGLRQKIECATSNNKSKIEDSDDISTEPAIQDPPTVNIDEHLNDFASLPDELTPSGG
jgi:hypothetical protein